MKQIILILFVFIIGLACSKQVKKMHIEPQIDTPVVVESPVKPKSKLEKKREKIQRVAIGKSIPDGAIISMDESVVSTSDYRGKLLVIDFWATWCGPCLKGAPKFKEIGDRYKSKKVAFISISIDSKMDTWKNFLVTNSWSGAHYWLGMQRDEPLFSFLYKEVDDEGRPLVIIGVPKYVIISPTGKILSNEAEFPTNPRFEERIKRLIKEYQ